MRIEGVAHEFSPIPGVVEDATDIILNLKQIPFKMTSEGVKTVRLVVDQPGDALSGQIETDNEVEVLDRDVHVATINERGKLNIEMRLKKGRGYVAADRNFDEDLPLGYIPIDSVHSPVRKVNFSVEAARLGQMTDYDKLTIEVWTNGAVSPQDAVGQAAKLLKDHMVIFINFEEAIEPAEAGLEGVGPQLSESAQSVGRGVGAERPLLQLPQERQYSDHRRPGAEDRSRDASHEELRAQVAQRDQGTAGRAGPQFRDAVRLPGPAGFGRRSPRQPVEADRGGTRSGTERARSGERRRVTTGAGCFRSGKDTSMRHKIAGFKLKRDPSARRALLRGLVTSVIEQERVITTVPKAKAVKPLVDKMITLAKRDTLHARRQAASFLMTPASVQKLFEKLGTRFGQRAGGYTRIIRLGFRKGDGAEQAMLELVGSQLVKRAADRAKRREERMKAIKEGRHDEEGRGAASLGLTHKKQKRRRALRAGVFFGFNNFFILNILLKYILFFFIFFGYNEWGGNLTGMLKSTTPSHDLGGFSSGFKAFQDTVNRLLSEPPPGGPGPRRWTSSRPTTSS